MKVGDLVDALQNHPRDLEVVIEEVYDSIPPDHLAEDEYDDYGGLPTGKYLRLSRVTTKDGKVVFTFL